MSLIIVYGPVASGKLTTAREVSRQTGYTLFDNHAINDVLAVIFPYTDARLNEHRKNLSRKMRYDCIDAALDADVSLVVTANYGGKGGLELFQFLVDSAKRHGRAIYFAHLVPPRETLYDRVVSPTRSNKANTHKRLDELLEDGGYGYETFPDVEHLQIDNSHTPVEAVARQILDHYSIERAK